ncbi:MAG: glycosyltransferase family 4 protein [Methylobacteriaceae bacterium]|nr:glycosyltransferase family 4 protein [Methylobacteriaceae bacterium]
MREALESRYQLSGSARVLHNASLVDDPGELLRGSSPKLRLGFLSNHCHEKGLDIALETFRRIRSLGLDAELTVAGPCATDWAQTQIEAAKAEFDGAFKAPGPVAGAAKTNFYQETDVFIFPSRYRYEAQPMVLLEAMAHGCVPIASTAGFAAELLGETLPSPAAAELFAERAAKDCAALAASPVALATAATAARARFLELRLAAGRQLMAFVEEVAGAGQAHAAPAAAARGSGARRAA